MNAVESRTAEAFPAAARSASAPTRHDASAARQARPGAAALTTATQVAIIGAGPYGLSVAAHLRARQIDFRIFGNPMESWLEQMPEGMFLKSEGFASNLYEPSGSFTLKRFCQDADLPYADIGRPVPLATMAAYGLAFQRRLLPDLTRSKILSLARWDSGFALRLETGETVTARAVVVATGISHFQWVPDALTHLPPELLSHSAGHRHLEPLQGKDVTVIGAGASALDLAALLHERGVAVRLVARRAALQFTPEAKAQRPLWHHLRYPTSGIGFGLRSRFYTDAPGLFRRLPAETRLRTVRTFLGPAAGWFVKDKILGRIPLLLGHTPQGAEPHSGRLRLQLRDGDGGTRDIVTDHVIAATGYKVDLRRLPFLDAELQAGIRTLAQAPVLSAHFESSVPGLFFVGLASANTFGPVMRFMFGANYAARRVAGALARNSARSRRSADRA